MPLASLHHESRGIRDALRRDFPFLLNASKCVADHVEKSIAGWERIVASELDTEFPFTHHTEKLESWLSRESSLSCTDYAHVIDEYADFCRAVKHPDNLDFWRRELSAAAEPANVLTKDDSNARFSLRLLLNEWRKASDKTFSQWQLEKIAALRLVLMRELQALLSLLQELHDQLGALGLDPGILLDLSKGEWSARDIEQLKRWVRYLADDSGVRSLCDLLGKLRQMEQSERIEQVRVRQIEHVALPDINSKEEIIGLRFGRDIDHVVPAEMALLADPDTSTLFDMKYAESRLMCFDMQGIQRSQRVHEQDEMRSVEESDKYGPMIILVDTSGSMQGMPETIAKAVALYMAGKARQQERPCFLINFSTGIRTLDLSDKIDMKGVLGFLGMSFQGGTDASPALKHALEMLQEERYQRADVLMISDFIMYDLPAEVHDRIRDRKEEGNRFYSLVIGDCFMSRRLESIFDHEWIYDPQSSRIRELIGFRRQVANVA